MGTERWMGLVLICCLASTGCPDADDDDSAIPADDDDDVTYVWPESFTGEVQVSSTLGVEPACDAVIELDGTRWDGICDDCDFAFSVQANLAVDLGTDACGLDPLWSYLPGSGFSDLLLAHAPAFGVKEWYGTYYYYDALVTGYQLDGLGPYWWVMSHENSERGTFSRIDDVIGWTWSYAGWVDVDPYFQDCGEIETSDATELYEGQYLSHTSLDCDGRRADSYEFVGEDGAQVTLSVDTRDADTAFDPAFYVNGPDGCTILQADDSFDCTFPPPAYRCPSASFDTQDGTYRVVVLSRGSCAGDEAGYTLHLTSPDPAVSLTSGVTISAESLIEVSGSGAMAGTGD